MRMRFWVVGKILLVPVIVAILAAIVMVLWNAVIPGLLSGASNIDYLHAVGLLILSRILFGGFRGGGWQRGRHWRKWQAMTPEERAKFCETATARHGWHHDS